MLFRKKNIYKDCAVLLADEGPSDNYIDSVKFILDKAKDAGDIAEGKSYLAAAFLFRGKLDDSETYFSECDTEKLPDVIKQSHCANHLLCLFLLNKFKEAEELYQLRNKYILNDKSILMRRSMGIHQFLAENYDAAVTVFLKASKDASGFSRYCPPMLDICLVKTLMKLDMYGKASEYAGGLDKYAELDKIGSITKQMKKKIFDKLSSADKVKMIKGKKAKK